MNFNELPSRLLPNSTLLMESQWLFNGLNGPIIPDDIREERKNILIRYFFEYLHHHSSYAFRLFAREILNLVNVVGQIYFTNYFLDGEFFSYGIDAFKFKTMNQQKQINPMSRIFPTLAKSGNVNSFDGEFFPIYKMKFK